MKKLLTLLIFCIHLSAFCQKPLPELWGLHVHDDAHILSQQTVDSLETLLKTYEDSTSNQLAVLIISSLEGEILEEYSLRVAEKWKLGQKDKDNGALLLIAVDDHKMRIETGQGLEGVLTDAVSNRVIRNEIAPLFRKGEYDTGVKRGINAMIRAIGGEYTADDTEPTTADLSLKERIVIGLFIFGILGGFTLIGLFASGTAGWFLYVFLIPFYASFPIVVFGLLGGMTALGIYVVAFPILRLLLGRTSWGKAMAAKFKSKGGGNSDWTGGGWSGGGSSWSSGGGDSSSSSSSDGGFSGEGGSFSGGGSSGSW